ncbi:Pyruvate carboxylase, partial [Lasiodiplodia hormozganensis]
PASVGTAFDSLLAKIVVTAGSRAACIRKAARALADVEVKGVATNLGLLRAVVASDEFARGECDTRWLGGEGRVEGLVGVGGRMAEGIEMERKGEGSGFAVWEEACGGSGGGGKAAAGLGGGGSGSTVLFRKGDAWNVTLEPRSDEKGKGKKPSSSSAAPTHHLELTRVLRNDFPSSLSAEVVFSSNATAAGPNASQSSSSTPYVMHLAATTTSSNAALSQHRRGRPDDPSHVCIPFAGKVVEVLVDEGDIVKEGDVICVVQQMKMELEVRSARAGRVTWVFEGEEGDEISEGTLACILELEGKEKARL